MDEHVCIRIEETGGPEVMRVVPERTGDPGPDEARVRHTAVGVNFIDVYHRTGLYPLPALPHGLGLEAAGVVEAVGVDVTEVTEGERVAYVAGPPGSYATSRCVPADRLVPVPDRISDEVAAASLLKGMTAEYLIRRTFEVKPGMTVLFHAAAGGVGRIAVQWLTHLGATVIGTVGTEAKATIARADGCEHAIVYTREDFAERVREITKGEGVPVVYDSVGRATFEGSIESLARRGMLVAFGNASGAPDPVDARLLSQKGSLYLTRPTLFDYTAHRDELLASAGALFEMIRTGLVRVEIGHRWPLAEVADAHRALEARRTTGSVVLLP